MTEGLNEGYDAEPDFWLDMAQRMYASDRRWWTKPDLSVLRRACAGAEMRYHTALWGRVVEDVCTGL